MENTVIRPEFVTSDNFAHYPADTFPWQNPVRWLEAHFAVGGWSPLHRLSGMLTAHMSRIAPRSGFRWHPHRGLEIYTWVLEGTLYHEDTTGGSGEIGAGELQRMFSGEYIEHQELNHYDDPVRVIQIWFAADIEHRGVEPHYQQLQRAELPSRREGDATVTSLIGEDSPMEQHMTGRLTATTVPANGRTTLRPPRPGEDLFLYVTDGAGSARHNGSAPALNQYDVILARPGIGESTTIAASEGAALHYLSFYLPTFLPA